MRILFVVLCLMLTVQPSIGVNIRHIRTHQRELITQQEQQQTQQQSQDPAPPKDKDELEFYNNPALGDVTLAEVSSGVGDTKFGVGSAIYGKGMRKSNNKETTFGFTLGACLRREKTFFNDKHIGRTAYRNDGGLTTIHDFFTDPMNVKFVIPDAQDNANTPTPYATVVGRKWFPGGDFTRIQWKPHAECTCKGARSGKEKWNTHKVFGDWILKNTPKSGINNAYYIGAVSKTVNLRFTGATQKLELDPSNNNHPRGSIDLTDKFNGRSSYDKTPVVAPAHSIPMFDVKIKSQPGDSGAGLYLTAPDDKGVSTDWLMGILSGVTDNDDYTKFTPVWDIEWPANYKVC